MTDEAHDVIVVGAALNGMATALALGGGMLRRPLNVLLVDAGDPSSFARSSFDGRASAVVRSSRRMLEALGIWPALADRAQAMNEIIVSDRAATDAPGPALLRFAVAEEGHGAGAHFIENGHIYGALLAAVEASPAITLLNRCKVEGLIRGPGLAEVRFADGGRQRASLVVAADGRASPVRELAGIACHGHDYGQTAIVLTVAQEKPHDGRAEEHFTPSGPFAVLPLPGNRSSIVWVERTADAAALLALDAAEFAAAFGRRFGLSHGAFTIVGERQHYPLRLQLAAEQTAARLALIGDAAHVVHPLAGLGFNLGLRDSAALAQCVHEAAALGLDVGGADVLARYGRWRRFDTLATAMAMEAINLLFNNDNPLLRVLRDLGLRAVDGVPAAKALFAAEAAGSGGGLPNLMRGELP
ncbi:MAG: 2-octaprenyl-6-methoxyphenyl hydroxylase [Alphaproteobacteria bacterium]|nr:2-octaprenyl-6-methoxyphenyl hydroxylase [Alphaproteobacteria bacterium]